MSVSFRMWLPLASLCLALAGCGGDDNAEDAGANASARQREARGRHMRNDTDIGNSGGRDAAVYSGVH